MIALLTPTGTRQKQIELCAKFMYNQDYTGPVLWVIVDDGPISTIDFIHENFRKNWIIAKIYPSLKWRPGLNTQCDNLITAVNFIQQYKPKNIKNLFIIEDDDYYSSRYLRVMNEKMGNYKLCGEANTIYYNPVKRGWRQNPNNKHSSLFQTVISYSIINIFKRVLERRAKFVDIMLYRHFVPRSDINLFTGENLAIGIKGLDGRPGIGIGHRENYVLQPDPDFKKLRELIGEDYKYYL